ncbi:hypothetical protein GNI_187940, partial [Gregarina niphandrodes]
HPLFRGKAQDKFLELAYFSYQWGKLWPNHVHDRGPSWPASVPWRRPGGSSGKRQRV